MLVFGGGISMVYPVWSPEVCISHPIAWHDRVCEGKTVLDESSPLKEPGKNKLVWNQLVKLGEAKNRLSF